MRKITHQESRKARVYKNIPKSHRGRWELYSHENNLSDARLDLTDLTRDDRPAIVRTEGNGGSGLNTKYPYAVIFIPKEGKTSDKQKGGMGVSSGMDFGLGNIGEGLL